MKKTTKTTKTTKNTARPTKPTITPVLINTAKGVYQNFQNFAVKIEKGKVVETRKKSKLYEFRLVKTRIQALLDAGWLKCRTLKDGWTRVDLTKRAISRAIWGHSS